MSGYQYDGCCPVVWTQFAGMWVFDQKTNAIFWVVFCGPAGGCECDCPFESGQRLNKHASFIFGSWFLFIYFIYCVVVQKHVCSKKKSMLSILLQSERSKILECFASNLCVCVCMCLFEGVHGCDVPKTHSDHPWGFQRVTQPESTAGQNTSEPCCVSLYVAS